MDQILSTIQSADTRRGCFVALNPLVRLGLVTLRRRLSYRRALELFGPHTTDFADGLFSLNHLRHSRLTHVVAEEASTPTPTRMSGHTLVRTPSWYARPSGRALMALRAPTDSAARRTARRM
ncbi:hypothetical protein [Nocardia testacea]|uniref:hypothetical protein n=1 Tax=Nocardia testacea TaxID=248551 RepID=UPI0033DE4C7A